MKQLSVLVLLLAVMLPSTAHAVAPRFGCCPHRFRLVFKHKPIPRSSFVLIDVYVYPNVPKGSRNYTFQPLCGPLYFAHRPCVLHHTYIVTAFEGTFPTRSWTAEWAEVRQPRGVVEMHVFHAVLVRSGKPTHGIPVWTATF